MNIALWDTICTHLAWTAMSSVPRSGMSNGTCRPPNGGNAKPAVRAPPACNSPYYHPTHARPAMPHFTITNVRRNIRSMGQQMHHVMDHLPHLAQCEACTASQIQGSPLTHTLCAALRFYTSQWIPAISNQHEHCNALMNHVTPGAPPSQRKLGHLTSSCLQVGAGSTFLCTPSRLCKIAMFSPHLRLNIENTNNLTTMSNENTWFSCGKGGASSVPGRGDLVWETPAWH